MMSEFRDTELQHTFEENEFSLHLGTGSVTAPSPLPWDRQQAPVPVPTVSQQPRH